MILILAADLLTNTQAISSARAALDDGLPGVAISKLEGIPEAARDSSTALLLARALVENGEPRRAMEVLSKQKAGNGREFWLAQAHASLGEADKALAAYHEAATLPEFSDLASLGEVRMLRQLGRPNEALALLGPEKPTTANPRLALLSAFEKAGAYLDLGDPQAAHSVLDGLAPDDSVGKTQREFLLAQALAMSGDDAGAIRLYDALVPTDASQAVAAVIGQAEALSRTGQAPTAESLVEGFISRNPDIPGLAPVFAVLDRLYSAQDSPSSSELKRWGNDPAPSPRRRLATRSLAAFEDRLGRADRAEELYEKALSDGDQPSAIPLAKIRIQQGRLKDALGLLPPLGTSPEADFLIGLALAGEKSYGPASEAFLKASEDPACTEAALFNAAACELASGSPAQPGFALLKSHFPDSPKLATLRLEEAFLLAKEGDPRAPELLESLAAENNPDMASKAAIALAEWKFEHNDRDGSLAGLRRISTAPGEDSARADALGVFLADDGTASAEAEAGATRFLQEHPGSPAEPEVLLKLGEILYHKGDFAGARVRLESLARKFPDSPDAMPALFLAAQASSRLQTPASIDDAMILFEEVAASQNPLALRARLEQAVLQTIQGKPDESIVILDRLLASNPDPEMRAAALMEKGKTLLSSKDPGGMDAAIKIWSSLADDPSLSPALRNQALFRIGAAYEKTGDVMKAVAAYYDVLNSPDGQPAELFWFYKAGFSAGRLLEEAKRWDQAIQVYQIVAAASGPRSEEATARINKIRLENFLWDDSPEEPAKPKES